jgi:hypothetical protein
MYVIILEEKKIVFFLLPSFQLLVPFFNFIVDMGIYEESFYVQVC